MQGFEIQTIADTVGAAACERGLEYARRGAVASITTVTKRGQQPKLVGTVRGSAPTPYSVIITSIPARGGSAGLVFGVCTCPVRNNCKHVAAVMYAAGRQLAGRRVGPAHTAWEDALGVNTDPPSVSGAGPMGLWSVAEAEELSVGLLIEAQHDAPGRYRLPMRPVLLGERGRWVRSGISWADAGYGRHGVPAAPARLLQEISALQASGSGGGYYYGAGPYHYGGRAATIDLATFPSGRIWDVLAEAPAASLPVISSPDGTPVRVAAERARVGLDLTDVAGDWSLTPTISVAGAPLGETAQLLGDPAHGVAWLTDDGGDAPPAASGRSPAAGQGSRAGSPAAGRVLHLARLSRPLDAGTRRMLDGARPILIPAADRQRFLRDFLPGLRHRVEVTSHDGSVIIPEREPGRLTLAMTHDRSHHVALRWRWRYRIGDEVIEMPPTGGDRPDLRDPLVEATALDAAASAVGVIPALRSWGPLGPALAPHAELAGADALRFERDVLPVLRGLDEVDVEVEDGAAAFREASAPPVVLLSGSAEQGTDWFDLAVTVTVDGQPVGFGELFRALATEQEFLILPSGTYFALDRPELHQLRALIEESRALADAEGDVLRVSRFQASFWAELEALGILDEQAAEWSRSVRELARVTDIPDPALPSGLRATLRPYQRAGYGWLSFLYDNGLGGVLADDMGLGKTVQALALICKAREDKPGAAPFLVVAPTSVVGNWVAETGRFAPDLGVLAITETESRRGIPLEEACAGVDVVVTSYALFRLEYDDYARINWSGLLVDEAQNIKNHQSRGYQCVRRLPAPFKLAITGTPMENNLMELWSIFSIGAPGLLGGPKRFTEYYRTAIERSRDADRLDQLRRRIRPLLMRRTKDEVVADLPPKTEQLIELELEPGHRRVYQRYLQRERRKVLGLLDDYEGNRFQIFRSLTLLRQAALDASLVDAAHASVKSTKLDALMEILADVTAEGHRVLVFSQFTRFLGGARRRLDAAGIEHCYLDGATRNRGAVLEEFKSGSAPVFLISLKAGGVGLNLTEADYCILLDPWWNPATEAQAVDRAHRIGQDKPVVVYRLVAKDTIEDKVMALKARKAALFSSIMSGGGVGAAGLTPGDIRGLLE